MRRAFRVAIVCLAWTMVAGATASVAQQLAVFGGVRDQRVALPGVTVTLTGPAGLSRQATTDASGRYRFDGLVAGSYTLSFVWAGREIASRSVSLTTESRELNVELSISTGEDASPSDPFHLRTTVIVTATRSEAEIDRSPLSASVITAEEIEARPQQTVDQQLTLTEGVYVQRLQGPSATDSHVAVRGFNSSSRTLVLLDGQPINDAYANSVNWTGLPIDEVESIEIARGPFSSLYGGNALGGVINIRTRSVGRRQLDLMGQYGTYDSSRVSTRFSDRFFERLGMTVGVERFRTGGYNSRRFVVTPGAGTGTLVTGPILTLTTAGARTAIVGEGGRNWLHQHAFRAKGEYTVGQASLISLQYLRMDYRYGYDGYRSYLRDANRNVVDTGPVVFDDNGMPRRLAVTPNNFLQGPGEQHSNFYSATYHHAFSSGSSIRVDGGYYHIPSFQFRSLGTGNTLSSGPGTLTDGNRHNVHVNVQYNENLRQHNLTFGAETRHDAASNSTFALSNWTVKNSKLNQTYFATGRGINQSAYVQDQFAVGPRVSLVLGARYDYWKGYDGASNSFNAVAPRTTYPERSRNQLTGKVALGYSLPRDWNLRVSAGTSFRNPNVFDLYATSVTGSGVIFAANPNLEPETVKSWEAGLRKRFGGRTSFDVAYYENHIKDLIYRQTDLAVDPNGNYRINVNAGGGRTRGVEVPFVSSYCPDFNSGPPTRTPARSSQAILEISPSSGGG